MATRPSTNGILCDTYEEVVDLGRAFGLDELALSPQEVKALASGAILWTSNGEYVTRVTFEDQHPTQREPRHWPLREGVRRE